VDVPRSSICRSGESRMEIAPRTPYCARNETRKKGHDGVQKEVVKDAALLGNRSFGTLRKRTYGRDTTNSPTDSDLTVRVNRLDSLVAAVLSEIPESDALLERLSRSLESPGNKRSFRRLSSRTAEKKAAPTTTTTTTTTVCVNPAERDRRDRNDSENACPSLPPPLAPVGEEGSLNAREIIVKSLLKSRESNRAADASDRIGDRASAASRRDDAQHPQSRDAPRRCASYARVFLPLLLSSSSSFFLLFSSLFTPHLSVPASCFLFLAYRFGYLRISLVAGGGPREITSSIRPRPLLDLRNGREKKRARARVNNTAFACDPLTTLFIL